MCDVHFTFGGYGGMYCFSACSNVFCSSCKEVVTKEEEKETVVGTEVEEEVDVAVVTEVAGDEIEIVVGAVVGTQVVQDDESRCS